MANSAPFPVRGETPYGDKVKTYVDSGDADAKAHADTKDAAHAAATNPHPQYIRGDGVPIADGTSIDTLLTPGNYVRTTSVGSTLALGYPTADWAGHIEVLANSTRSFVLQRASFYSTAVNLGSLPARPRVWTRTKQGAAAFTAWVLDDGVATHEGATDPHTAAGYARKGVTNTFTSLQRIETAGGAVYLRRTNGSANARDWGLYGEVDGSLWITPLSDAGVGNGLSVRLDRLGNIRAGDVYYSQGTGSPEGVVVGTPGSRYVDRNATNGAIEWLKFTGTGNTGWRVVGGDTGWRTLPLPENLTMTDVPASYYQIRRINETVHVRMRVKAAGTLLGTPKAQVFTLMTLPSTPAGFLSSSYVGHGIVTIGTTPGGIAHTHSALPNLQFSPFAGLVGSWTSINGDIIGVSISYQTDHAWPTVLPGTAA